MRRFDVTDSRKMRVDIRPVLVALALLAGCGSSSDPTTYSEQQVITAAGFQSTPAGHTLGSCAADPIILGADQIATYRDAGDTLVTNPSGTVAVKTSDPVCGSKIEAALQALP